LDLETGERATCKESSEKQNICIYFFVSECIFWESLGSQPSKCCTGGRRGSARADNVTLLFPTFKTLLGTSSFAERFKADWDRERVSPRLGAA